MSRLSYLSIMMMAREVLNNVCDAKVFYGCSKNENSDLWHC